MVLESLNADAVGRVRHFGIEELDIVDSVIVAASDAADGETVTTVAVAVLEDDVL